MAASTRHLRRRELAEAAAADEEDEGLVDALPRLGVGGRCERSPPPGTRSSDAPSAWPGGSDSVGWGELGRYLLAGNAGTKGEDTPEDGGVPGGMGMVCTEAYAMACEPMGVRRQSAVMLFEAYAIFGGLFLAGTWVLYEWGSPSAHGNSHSEITDRIFEAIMAVAICSNIFLALWSTSLWMAAIVYGARENFVLEARGCVQFCETLMTFTVLATTAGMLLAIYQNLYPRWPEFTVVTGIFCVLLGAGPWHWSKLVMAVSPLTVYHRPGWNRRMGYPMSLSTRGGRERFRERAREEAERLRSKVRRERGYPNEMGGAASTAIGTILREAAANMGRDDCDVSAIERRLEDDWLSGTRQLQGKGVDFLSRYMPYGLAEEVHALVDATYSSRSRSSFP